MVVALLTIPAVAARCWTDRLALICVIAACIGAFSGAVGTGISALGPKFSAGPVITLVAAACFLVSLFAAPKRGIFASWLRERALRRKIALQNVLRAVYEVQEARQSPLPVPRRDVALKRSWSPRELSRVLARATRAGFVQQSGDEISLTAAGREEAASLVRTHRLWEMFLMTHADIASDHVDRDADAIEHILSPELIAELEDRLRDADLAKSPAGIPASPHGIAPHTSAGVHA
jgi:manganese/zinc/iron transport system permease protein